MAAKKGDAASLAAKTIWWHQIDDGDEAAYDVHDVSEWAVAKDLTRSRLSLMSGRKGSRESIATLRKLRSDLLLYARDAC